MLESSTKIYNFLNVFILSSAIGTKSFTTLFSFLKKKNYYIELTKKKNDMSLNDIINDTSFL